MRMRPKLASRSFRRAPSPVPKFKLLSAVLVLTLYFCFFRTPSSPPFTRPRIQRERWANETGLADDAKVEAVIAAMRHTFWNYRELAWGSDGIKPVSGHRKGGRNGWGAFIVDSASTLAQMGLWKELALSIDHIVAIDFNRTATLVDPFETTIRYLGGLLSLVDLIDVGAVPPDVASPERRDAILAQAVRLAEKLAPAYDTAIGMPFPRVNFAAERGEPDPPSVYKKNPSKRRYDHPAIGPARAGSNILEHRTLSRLTDDTIHAHRSQMAWSTLVWSPWIEPFAGIVDAPIDIETGAPVGRDRHWDAGHDSYYEYLIKAAILAPGDKHSDTYSSRWINASLSLRANLSSRSSPAPLEDESGHAMQHQFIGKYDDSQFLNEMSHLACFAPGNLILGGTYLAQPNLVAFGQALLEGCRHTYNASATGIGPEVFSWTPMTFSAPGFRTAPMFAPQDERQKTQLREHGFWAVDPVYRLRPEYVESLFYAWRITGEPRYREWAWDAFSAIQRQCRTRFGYASLADVTRERPHPGEGFKAGARMARRREKERRQDEQERRDRLMEEEFASEAQLEANAELVGGAGLRAKEQARAQGDEMGEVELGLIDESESFWAAETLKYLYLIFADVRVGSLDQFVYSTEGHPFRMIG